MFARAAAVSLGVLLAILPLVTGVVGYYVGSNRGASVAWTDREFTATRVSPESVVFVTLLSTMHCTYHLADGSTRRVDSQATIRLTVSGSDAAVDSRVCPPAP